ncbi:MAG: sigma-70 family RNA polymerase sigma factor [Chloroflexi bacterium]|nr:MAG: sigma-70 family RNA polymerase sigma factor [Chloroflexota bacterium]
MAASVALAAFVPAIATPRQVTFSDAVREHQDEVYGVALRITGDRDSALDVTSSTFLKAYRAFDRYDPSRPVRFWLLRIATNEAISHARRRGREMRRRADEDAAGMLPDPALAPDALSIAREDQARIRAAVAALPELYRVVVVLRYFNELGVDEIAQVTGRPASTVGVQLLRGRALLRRALEATG